MGERRVVGHDQVVAAATQLFIQQARLDMDELAREMAVSRATLYRVVGSRERLLGDVLDRLSVRTLDPILCSRPGTGVEWLLDVVKAYSGAITSFGPLRRFMRNDPELAFRVLFMPEAALHSRSVARWRCLIEQADLAEPGTADDLAFVAVRLGESMMFTDVFAGREPNVELSMRLLRTMFSPATETASQKEEAWQEFGRG